ncbi:NADH-ubiquinone oxidoreductase-F iron-sulfur binding region domain-containing protein [Konateibacter massiliensis]|uniref:NADH-ubiquinone oxidoreductase-F iron-sulfur binding region domain-containing protein n=1 Tax=Konateibacter massiliensis TaxID=2002841 RepID=UPI000C14F936|nr:NADH-ubiquinone oxidoreductase-F iron-sulfur binding region domain-containing protein [Konateibacter massiliensis]
MKEIFVCNAMPIYEEAPISPSMLKENLEQISKEILKNPASKHYLVVPKNQAAGVEVKGITVIEAKKGAGFTYTNHSALLKVLEGEKPIPSRSNSEESDQTAIVSVEELLGAEKKKVFVGGKAKKTGIQEFNKKTTPREILNVCESKGKFKGMFFGYPMGLVINQSKLDEEIILMTDYIQIIDETDCVLDIILKIADRFGKESCGRCVFGHEGVTQIQMILTDITLKKGKQSDLELLLDLCQEMKMQSLCEVGSAIAGTIQSAMDSFGEEIEEHITKKSCKAGVCAKYVTYHILADMCTGCNECVDECEDDAILGKKKFIHVIDQDECTQCGACLEACDEDAIVKAGAVKPRCPKKPIPCK